MKRIVLFSILVILCLFGGCICGKDRAAAKDRPSVHVIYTPDPANIPEEFLKDINGLAYRAAPVL